MKKTLLLLASAALLFTGCAKEMAEKNAGQGGDIYSFTVGVGSEAAKATIDNDGEAANINHWIMQVLDSDGAIYNYQEKDAAAGTLQQTFDVPLIKGQTYQVLFWADTKGNYEVSDLRNVTRAEAVALTANRDDLDAFSAAVNDFTTTVATRQTITLYRPFAQMNVVFTDLKKLYETMGSDAEYAKFKPVNFVAKAKVPTSFNVLTQEAGAPAETALEMNAAENYKDNYAAHAEKATLYMDYILATKGSKDVVDIDFSFISKGVEIAHDFTSIPFQRNYRTNIIGEFMSANAQWKVIVEPTWDGEYDKEYEAEGSVAAAIDALKAGKTAVEIVSPEDYATPVALPAQTDGKDISIKVSGVSGKEMTFNLAEGAQGPANLYITSDAQDIVIDCPNSHVEVNGGEYQSVEATTSATTLVVGKDVTIETLNVKKGNVEIHGKVANLTRVNSVKAAMYASDRATLVNYINWAKAGDIAGLECDINLAGENWTPLRSGNRFEAIFDGQGYTISNMTIRTDMANGVGFFSDMTGGCVIKNFTMDGADIANNTDDKGNMYGIISGYAYGNASFENITVKNSKIHAFGKVAAILGMAADGNGTTVVKNCTVEDTEIIGAYNVANYVGLVQNAIVLEGCTSTNVEKKLGGRYGEEAYKTFDNVKVIDRSDPANPKYVLSSGKYWVYAPGLYYAAFADCYNDIHYLEWEALDGTVDALVFNTPDAPEIHDLEPVATIGDKKYYDLPSAFAAVKAGETLNIWQAGEYTLPATLPNITVSGNVDDIVFNCVGSGSIASISNGATFKSVTMNFGQSSYHGFQHAGHIIMEECILNGLFFSYGDMTFNGCTFNQENEEYNMWTYAGDITYDGCTFNSKGKFLNIYRESAIEYEVVAKDCVFNTSKASKAALNIKETSGANFLKYNVTITNCSCNDTQNTLENKDDGTLYRISPIWQVDDRKDGATGINVTVDGVKLYPFYSQDADGNFHVANAKGLFAIAKDINTSKSKFYNHIVYLDADIDLANAAWTPIAGGMSGDFDFDFDGQNHEVKNVAINANGSANAAFFGNWSGDIKNLTINTITVTNGAKRAAGLVGQMATGTIANCHVINANIQSSNFKVGGLVGSVTADPCTIKNCSVKNSSIEGLEQVGGFCGSLGTGDGGATRFIDNVVENITITTSNEATAKDRTFGAYVGTYYVAGYVAENTNNTISGTNDIYSPNEGFGILLQQ